MNYVLYLQLNSNFLMAKIYDHYDNTKPNAANAIAQIRPEILKERFLELYMQCGHVTRTCQILGLIPRTVYRWKQTDIQFADDWAMADRVALSILEDAAIERAVHGIQKPVYQGGKLCGYVTEFSDQLLIVLLKARDPKKYRENTRTELTGADGKPLVNDMKITHVHSNLELATSEDQIVIEDIPSQVVSSELKNDL